MKPKWTKEKERVVMAALRWYRSSRKILGEKSGEMPGAVRILEDEAFSVMRACAALVKRGARGRK